MPLLKPYIQIRQRLRRATKDDLVKDKKPQLGLVYYIMLPDGSMQGSFVFTNDTNKKDLNHLFNLERIYVEDKPLNNYVTVELYEDK